MRFLFASLILALLVFNGVLARPLSQATEPSKNHNLTGTWRVEFELSGMGKKILEINSRVGGTGSFVLLDDGPNGKTDATPLTAAWTQLSNDRVSFSGEIELQVGNCCREMGTLMLKGRIQSSNSITGRAVFVTSTTDEENIIGFRSMVGTFTAKCLEPRNTTKNP